MQQTIFNGNSFIVPDKIGPMQEQIRKLQQRLAQISQDTQFLNERKNVSSTHLCNQQLSLNTILPLIVDRRLNRRCTSWPKNAAKWKLISID